MASGPRWPADVARETTAWMRCGAEATWQDRGWPTRGAGGAQGADTWQEATRVHGSMRTPVWGATWQERVGIWRAHGLVGLGKIVRAVTRKRYTAPQFKLYFFQNFLRMGLCPTRLLPFARDVGARQASDLVSDDRMASIAWTRVHLIKITARA